MNLPRKGVLSYSPQLQGRKQTRKGDDDMRKLMMVAAAAAIALVGLSANTCGGGDQKPAEQPATQPEAQPTQPETAARRSRRRNSPQLTQSADLGLLPLAIAGRTPPYFSALPFGVDARRRRRSGVAPREAYCCGSLGRSKRLVAERRDGRNLNNDKAPANPLVTGIAGGRERIEALDEARFVLGFDRRAHRLDRWRPWPPHSPPGSRDRESRPAQGLL